MSVIPLRSEMGRNRVSLAEELKPFMILARVMGVAPYTIKNNIYTISPYAFAYSIILNVANLILALLRMDETIKGSFNMKVKGLYNVLIFLSLSPIILNTIYAVLRRRETGELFKIVNKFDALINLRPATKKHFSTIWAFVLSTICMIVIYGILTFDRRWPTNILKLNGILIFGRIVASVGFFLAMLRSMLRRFQEINRMIERDSKDLDTSEIVLRKSMGLRKVWILYDHLMEATENVNSMYSAELLLWIFMSSFQLLRHLHLQWNYELKTTSIFASGIIITMTVLRLVFLTWFCHRTASMANKIAGEAFRVNSRVLKMNRSWDDEDTMVIGQYFLLRRSFQITAGGGFLRINLPLLRTIAATILTYLVILRSPGEKLQAT